MGSSRTPPPTMLQRRPAQELSFGPRALKDALLSRDVALQQLYATAFSPAERLFLAEAYSPRRMLFGTPLVHSAFDWPLSRPEAPEDFETFHAALGQRRPGLARRHIYLQPIGLSEGPAGCPLLDDLRRCAEAFFPGLQVRCLPPVPAASIRCASRPGQDLAGLQLHTDGILALLKNSKPEDALCVLGLTLADLYPHETWRFTFSKFLPGHEVGVCSFARFSREHLRVGPEPVLAEAAAAGQDGGPALGFSALGLVQCCKVACHELCHLLGLGNCRWLRCLMQGALSLDEALRRPLDLCPICLRKLQHVLGFRLLDRYKRLHAWTWAVAESWPGQEASVAFSTDSGVCCESDSEPASSPLAPPTPDVLSHLFPEGPEPNPEDRPSCLAAMEAGPQPGGPEEAVEQYGRWLAACIQALEQEVAEEELAKVDQAVDALERWDLFTGQLPAARQGLPSGRDSSGLRKALGNKFSLMRWRLSTRRLFKAEPPHQVGEA